MAGISSCVQGAGPTSVDPAVDPFSPNTPSRGDERPHFTVGDTCAQHGAGPRMRLYGPGSGAGTFNPLRQRELPGAGVD